MSTRTNIVLDDELIAKAMQRANVTTKKAAVEAALLDFVREPDWAGLTALRGSNAFADDYEPFAVRDTSGMTYPKYEPKPALTVRESEANWQPSKPVAKKRATRAKK